MRLAYLCNVYPAVSHSFVRREIEAVEAAGNVVHRFSVRQPGAGLKDPAIDAYLNQVEEIVSNTSFVPALAA